ncbi:MAG: PAS domain S-box protein [Candidatus Melainabacteria bacterium]|nr:MAG: PAS domain S-box protein [Candidatus Melainabacteria bacterium]
MSIFADTQAKRQELFLRHLVNSLHERAIFAVDEKGMITTWSNGSQNLLGYDEEEILGKHLSIFFDQSTQGKNTAQKDLEDASSADSTIVEHQLTRKNTSQFHASLKYDLLQDDSGNKAGFAVLIEDLTEKKDAQKNKFELKKLEDTFNSLVSAVKDYAIFLISPEGIILTWNEGAQRAKGYSADEIIGRHFSTFYTQHDKDRNHPQFELEQAIKDGRYEEEGWRIRKDGTPFWANVTITPILDSERNHKGFIKVTRDLSERREIEANRAALAKADETFDMLVAAVKDYAIFLLSPEGNILTWNEGARRNKGYTAEEIVGCHFSTFYTKESVESGHPDWELEQAIAKGQYEEEGWRVKKDGTQFWASVSITAIFDRTGVLTGFVKVTRDLTERREAELGLRKAVIEAESARDEAERANRLKSEFVATISHEIRTPMSGLIGLAELLMHEPDHAELPEMAQRMFKSSRKLLDVLNSLLDFSKLESGRVLTENISFSPRAVLQEVVGLVSPLVQAKSLALETVISKNVPEQIFADEVKVRQVLNNLLHNAVKFTSKGKIRIKIDRLEMEGNDSISFSVKDTGIGIREEHKSMMFEPFVQADPSFTRKFGGTGLGLSICRHYVTLMGGSISLESTEGKGSTFSFTIPVKANSFNE